jgi:RNA polymerase sigma factor (sigma-70 family)
MRPRESLLELFSTFLQLESERCNGWVREPKLYRSMQNCLSQHRHLENSEKHCVLHWHKLWQTEPAPFARHHLIAYLQESCYWAAYKITRNFTNPQYTLSDYFQVAITAVDKVLKGFQPSPERSLKKYANAIFISTLADFLRQRQEMDICTDYALLRKLSQKRLTEALENTGLSQEIIASYILLWNCFKALYVPTPATGTRKLLPPDQATWAAITQAYNQQRLSQLSSLMPALTIEMVEASLLTCAKASRAYLYPNFVSLNVTKSGDQSGEEFLESLPETATDSLLNEMISQEEQQSQTERTSKINEILEQAICQLDNQAQTILQLYYAQGLTQQQIAQQLDLKQYTVSRRLTKIQKSLLLALAQWSQEQLHILLNTDLLKDISTVVEEWLALHYSRPEFVSKME